jgi:signal transduction histidine kinase
VLDYLPKGKALDPEVFRRRHLFLCWILALHVPALYVFGLAQGFAPRALALEVATPALCLILARVAVNRRLAAFFVTAGLVYCSSVLVHLSGGMIEAHFHFFILIPLIALYQDWIPFLWDVIFTVLSHGLGSAWASHSIFNHHAGQAHPWTWALIHGVAVLAACVGTTIFWRSVEIEQDRNEKLAADLSRAEMSALQAEASQRQSVSELFVNLARRNQSLLDRQLELISDLEQKERRPDSLSELFKLDHLATRIRRNAESLLVLSGDDPPRRWGRPVPLGDVVRAAAAEVEDYRRVEVMVNDHLEVAGRAVADLAHLLAELIENATTFSPPGSEVRVRSHLAPGDVATYVLSIEDVGIGMSESDLAVANDLLSEPPDVDLRRSRLGFHVVSRLAKRYGLQVKLGSTPGGGVTALVTLPPDLISERRVAIAAAVAAGGVDVYALPEPSTGRVDGTAPGWRVAPPMPGADPPPAEAWLAPPPHDPIETVAREATFENWEVAPLDRPLLRPLPGRPPANPVFGDPPSGPAPASTPVGRVRPQRWQAPPPLPPLPDPAVPAAPAGDLTSPPAEAWQVATPAGDDEPPLPTRVPGATPIQARIAPPEPTPMGPVPPADPSEPAHPVPAAGLAPTAPVVEPADLATAWPGTVEPGEPADGASSPAEDVPQTPAAPTVGPTGPAKPTDPETGLSGPAEDLAAAPEAPIDPTSVPAEDLVVAPVEPAPGLGDLVELSGPVDDPTATEPAAAVETTSPAVEPAAPAPPVPSVAAQLAEQLAAAPPPPLGPRSGAELGYGPADGDGPGERPVFTGWPPTLRGTTEVPPVPAFLRPPPELAGGIADPTAAGIGTPPPPPADAPPTFTADGLVKRVPGARLAKTRGRTQPDEGPATAGFEPPTPDSRRQHTSSMLSRFQAAQRDGRAAAEAPNDPPAPEEPS